MLFLFRTRNDSQNGPVTKVSETKINLIQRGAGPTPEQRKRDMERVEAELRKEPRTEEEVGLMNSVLTLLCYLLNMEQLN